MEQSKLKEKNIQLHFIKNTFMSLRKTNFQYILFMCIAPLFQNIFMVAYINMQHKKMKEDRKKMWAKKT